MVRGTSWSAPVIDIRIINGDVGYKLTISSTGVNVSERITDGSLKTFTYNLSANANTNVAIYLIAGGTDYEY